MFNIQDFCAKEDDSRYIIHGPIPYAGWLYATNGHIAVRVRPVEALPDTDDKIGLLLAKQFTIYHPAPYMEPLPVYPTVIPSNCQQCSGAGVLKNIDECEECLGEGIVEWDSNLHSYEATCKKCLGYGEITDPSGPAARACDLCMGLGANLDVPVKFGETAINYRYLGMMQRLPSLLVCLSRSKFPDPIPFIFDGGQGLVMPIKF